MSEFNLDRKNTYTNDEYFKIVVLSLDEEAAIADSRWLTDNNKKLMRTDILRSAYKKTSLVCYPRWNGEVSNNETKAFEGLCIFAEDQQTWERVLPVIEQSFKQIFAKVLVSSHPDAAGWAEKINAKIATKKNRLYVVQLLDSLDMDEYTYIFDKFSKFDDDNSGYINTDEMPKMVELLGEDGKSEQLKEAILAFDTNQDGKLSMNEFIVWWKIGRKDLFAFKKFFDVNVWAINKMNSIFNIPKVERCMSNEELTRSTKLTNTDFYLNTQNIDEYVTRVNLKAGIGGKAREEACKNYLSRYSDKIEFNSDYFIDFAFFVKSCTIEGHSSKDYIEKFKDDLIDKIDKTYIPGLKGFLGNFIVVKTYAQEYSINLHFEFKYDIQELLKSALTPYFNITNWLTNNGKQPLDLDLRFFSGKCLGDLIDDDSTLKDLLESTELKIKFQAVKDKLKALLTNIKPEYEEIINFIKPLTIPANLNLKYEGLIHELNDSKSKQVLDKKLIFLVDLLDFVRKNIPEDLRKVMNRLEIGANIVDTFFSAQLFSNKLWYSDQDKN